jgi:hypothetical protein
LLTSTVAFFALYEHLLRVNRPDVDEERYSFGAWQPGDSYQHVSFNSLFVHNTAAPGWRWLTLLEALVMRG